MVAAKANASSRVLLGAALCWPWLFIWQGLDFTDQGYLLTGYRCFFKYPQATEDSASTWLTTLVGAIWDALFGKWGVVSVRALWALCMSLGLLLAFRLVRSATSERAAAVSVLAASIFLSDRRETWFSYNTSSSLLFVAAAVSLTLGLVSRRRGPLLTAGVVIGALPFARLPNVLAAGLVIAPCLAALVEKERRAGLLRELGLLLAGIGAGFLGTLGLVYALGHGPMLVNGIRGLFAPSASQSGYGMDSLLANFIKDELTALAWGLGVCLAGAAVAQVFRRVPALVSWPLVVVLGALAAYGLAGTDELWRFVAPGTGYWLLAAVALGYARPSFEQRALAFTALAILIIAPLGSNNGIKNAHMGLWLALPLLLSLLFSLNSKLLADQGSKLAIICCLALTGEGLHRAATYTYRDSTRSRLTASVPYPQLRGQFTSPARAKSVAQVLQELNKRVAPGDYLLAYEGTPLLQYLTRTRPYLNRPWLMGAVSSEEVAQLAAAAPQRTGCLPVAVVTRKSTRGFDWPRVARGLEQREPQRRTRRVLNAFLRRHGYERTWTNGFFEILEPPSVRPGSCR